MSKRLISGVYAAVTTPRLADGCLDLSAIQRSLEFLLEKGVGGMALNGATGEFCVTTPQELKSTLDLAVKLLAGRAHFVCGIGSAHIRGALELGRLAIDCGARALMLPMPHFFPYAQDDLEAFCRQVADALPAPILLYNLPQFTSGLEPSTVERLIAECPGIVGIKDSSGSPDILRRLTQAGMDTCRIVGNDGILAQALREEICDGVISGVAGVLPELIQALYGQREQPDSEEFQNAERTLKEFIVHLDSLPTPWGLKWIAESRGLAAASFSQPLSPRRAAQARELQAWFTSWHAR